MDKKIAVQAADAFARLPGVKAWAQLRLDGDTDVFVDAPRHRRRVINLHAAARAYFRQVRQELLGL